MERKQKVFLLFMTLRTRYYSHLIENSEQNTIVLLLIQ